ncbi:MAG TPA: hypothetical protein VMH05_12290 [Bryobacteraceae bacterium]|nr:hypothetical protein [Bryobacteraceae bacterium]
MNGVLVDSDVLIDVLRERRPTVLHAWHGLANSGEVVCYSPVSVAEIRHGTRVFHKSHAVALGDALIAATASVHGLTLWTQNRKHFPVRSVRFFGEQRLQ